MSNQFEQPENYRNRELSWLEFDYRVLSEARDKSLPLFERLKFLSITASNLDEFFMIRVASLKDMVHAGYTKPDIAGMKPQEQLLTFLAVVGIQPQASDALSQVQENMSEETSAIQEQIKQRIATMSEAERTAFEDALMEYFPMETVTIDGQEYTWFTIDLEVNVDGVIRIERYGFRLEGESWIFAKLEIST